ncbi:carbohydrate kinase family protein [Ruminiclostridium cellobioparum]|uniref:PfkB domain-containing protein n=1 Tax=Ruminiclostridium cellobioparum subsp. termitidis CT1112 TaxID=1195236 RepID=S0FVD7_RUMCE|nr:PfkB family carbohydrate kinase [Ruminiclostridium cellobioparum]EMS72498.1 PfkB domain-containing protein [Ruminiclostridium cellobioparum subsp. termitidis CT1112]
MKYDVLVNGYVSLDRIIRTSTPLRYGYTSLVENSDNARIQYGGCSTNIAYLMAKLNMKALPLIRVGGDDYIETGFYDHLKNAGVCMDAVEIVPDETTSNCYLIADSENNHVTIFYPGAMDKKYAKGMDPRFFKEARTGIMTVGSYEDNLEFYRQCKAWSVPLVFGMKCDYDAFPEEFFKEVLLYSKIIFCNECERGEIQRIFGLEDITELFEKGNAEIIVTTLGKKGSVYYHKTKDGILSGHITAAEFGKVVDTTGSGDAFMSGFLYGYLKGRSVKDCCSLGSVLSSFIIEKVGCTTNAPDEEAFLKRFNEFIKGEE